MGNALAERGDFSLIDRPVCIEPLIVFCRMLFKDLYDRHPGLPNLRRHRSRLNG